METCPWGEWAPKRVAHMCVPDQVHQAMEAALMVFRANRDTRLPLYAAHLILSLVCTRDGWDL